VCADDHPGVKVEPRRSTITVLWTRLKCYTLVQPGTGYGMITRPFRWLILGLLIGTAAEAKAPDKLIVYDELPSTLNPLYATSMTDIRAQELVYERLFFTTPIS